MIMRDTLLREIQKNHLVDKSDKIVVALSGGADSMVLYDVLRHTSAELILAHVNYNRREESEKEAENLRGMADKHGVPIEIYDVKGPIEGNFQEKAREIRYAFFARVAKKYKAQKIALGHHLDDQIETFFMRLVKGASFDTLKGMDYEESFGSLNIIRPFLNLDKELLLKYAQRYDILYFFDISNEESTYTRNRFRNAILPLFKQENPAFNQTMHHLVNDMKTATRIIEEHVMRLSKERPKKVNISEFLNWEPLVQRLFLKIRLSNMDSTLHVSKGLFKELKTQLQSENNFQYPLSDTVTLHKEYGEFFIAKTAKKKPAAIDVDKQGSYFVENTKHFTFTDEKYSHNASKTFELWYNDRVFPLSLRTRREGDVISLPYGHKKLKDLFIDMKIPPHKRDRLWVVAKGNEIVWIPEIDVGAKQESAQNTLYIHFFDDDPKDAPDESN